MKILWQHQDVLTFFTQKNDISMTFLQQIISSRLLQVVIGGQKSSFIGKFKLEPITIYYIWFVMKVLWKLLWTNQKLYSKYTTTLCIHQKKKKEKKRKAASKTVKVEQTKTTIAKLL